MSALKMQALAKATEYRCAKAQIKHDLKAGTLTFAQLLEDIPPCVAKIPVQDALSWIPRVGKCRARLLVRDQQGTIVSETLPLSKLGPVTRERLLTSLKRTGVER